MDGLWVSEAWGQDAVSILAVLADRTERIHLGSALMQIPARPPTGAAMAAATIDVISNGRFRMGLGVSGPQVSEGWYGVPFTRPLSRTREYVEIVRKAWAREVGRVRRARVPAAGHRGDRARQAAEADDQARPGGAADLPRRDRARRRSSRRGEIANGWLPAFFNPYDCDRLMEHFDRGPRQGRARARRPRPRPDGPRRGRGGRRGRARGRAAVRRLLPRRDGRQGQELLRGPLRRLRLRGRGARDPGPLPLGRPDGRDPGGDAGHHRRGRDRLHAR